MFNNINLILFFVIVILILKSLNKFKLETLTNTKIQPSSKVNEVPARLNSIKPDEKQLSTHIKESNLKKNCHKIDDIRFNYDTPSYDNVEENVIPEYKYDNIKPVMGTGNWQMYKPITSNLNYDNKSDPPISVRDIFNQSIVDIKRNELDVNSKTQANMLMKSKYSNFNDVADSFAHNHDSLANDLNFDNYALVSKQ